MAFPVCIAEELPVWPSVTFLSNTKRFKSVINCILFDLVIMTYKTPAHVLNLSSGIFGFDLYFLSGLDYPED